MEAEQDKTWSQLAAHFKRFFELCTKTELFYNKTMLRHADYLRPVSFL